MRSMHNLKAFAQVIADFDFERFSRCWTVGKLFKPSSAVDKSRTDWLHLIVGHYFVWEEKLAVTWFHFLSSLIFGIYFLFDLKSQWCKFSLQRASPKFATEKIVRVNKIFPTVLSTPEDLPHLSLGKVKLRPLVFNQIQVHLIKMVCFAGTTKPEFVFLLYRL